MIPPDVAVVVVAHGDDPRVRGALDALRSQEGVVVSVVLVENGAIGEEPVPLGGDGAGKGGAVAAVRRLRRGANPGFAGGFNEGAEIAMASGAAWIASVNPDCRLAPDALARALDAARAPDVGAVAFRLTRPGGEKLDSAGVLMHPVFWRAADRGGGGGADGRFLAPDDVDATCMAGALFRRTALEAARDGASEILDSRYFAYQEDVDLGWRIRRAGFRVRFAPDAAGVHERGWKEGSRRSVPLALRRASLRNRLWTVAKNAGRLALLVRLPALLLFEAVRATYLLFREPAVLAAYVDAAKGMPATLRRRRPERPHA